MGFNMIKPLATLLLLVVSQDQRIDMKTLFEHELTNVPVAIANSDGSLYKANKSQTLKDIELE